MPGLKKYNFLNYKTIYSLTTIALLISGNAYSQAPLQFPTQWEQTSVSKITIVGNKSVTNEAILNLRNHLSKMSLRKNSNRKDI